jgi:histidinol-phosphate aminotransferase
LGSTSIAELLPRVLLLLDEAYADTAPAKVLPALALGNPQISRLRTFSKAYGLAGARIGYALGETGLIQQFNKIRNHYGVDRIAQAAAIAAISDQAYLAEAVAEIMACKERLIRIALENGLKPLPCR